MLACTLEKKKAQASSTSEKFPPNIPREAS